MSEYCKNCFELSEKLTGKEHQCDRYSKALKEIQEISTNNYYDDNWYKLACRLDSIHNIVNKVMEGK